MFLFTAELACFPNRPVASYEEAAQVQDRAVALVLFVRCAHAIELHDTILELQSEVVLHLLKSSRQTKPGIHSYDIASTKPW